MFIYRSASPLQINSVKLAKFRFITYRTFDLSGKITHRYFCPLDFHIRQDYWDKEVQTVIWTNLSPVNGKVHIGWVTALRDTRHMHCIIFLKTDHLLIFENFDHSKVLTQKLIIFSLVHDQYIGAQRHKLKPYNWGDLEVIFWGG